MGAKAFFVLLVLLVTPLLADENSFKEYFRIKVWNLPGGTVEVSRDQGKSWEELGRVIRPTTRVDRAGYAASRWVDDGKVAATSVNAIHVKTRSGTDEQGMIFSLLPREFNQLLKQYGSYFSPDSSVYTDIPAGEGIFGGGWAPFVGNVVMVSRPGAEVVPIPKDFIPAIGDKIYIMVDQPVAVPKEIFFENWAEGKVTIKYWGGEEEVIGKVVQPVAGIGRFEGTRYASPGRIRANHAGVIDVSTSPLGKIGGFQIVPSQHGAKMGVGAGKAQYLIVAPVEEKGKKLEGRPPLFKSFIRPDYLADDLTEANWRERLEKRFLVDVKLADSKQWEPMPVIAFDEYFLIGGLPPWANKSLENVSRIRILFPASE